jgi:hypothetical protein
MLQIVTVRQTGTRVSAEDQGMMERLERLEEQMGRFGEKLETLCANSDIPFDERHLVRRPRLSLEVFPTRSGAAQAATLSAASLSPAMERAESSSSNGMNTDAPAPPSTPSLHAELTSEDAAPNVLSDDAAAATFDALDAPVVDAEPTSAIPAKGENISALPVDNQTHAAHAISPPLAEPAETAAPAAIPGVNIIQPTPDNSQEAVQRSFNLIPPGAINAAGMRTRSRSRSRTLAPQETDVAMAAAQTDSSRGGNESPLPFKRPLDAEDSSSKRQRTG